MELLTSLGVNSTLWTQLALFLVTFVILNNLVFKPYAKAHIERDEKAVGDEDLAKQLYVEAQDLEFNYEKRARQINDEIRTTFDKARTDANKKHSEIIEKAREEAQTLTKQTGEAVAQKVQKVRQDLQGEVPSISKLIVQQLVGKEL